VYVNRQNKSIIFNSFTSPYISAVLGPRRVGKSTLVQSFIDQNLDKKWVMLNMDIRAERLRVEGEELALLIEEKSRQKIEPQSPLFVSIDEAQKCPSLFEQIKVLYDRWKGTPSIKFILTGSGALSLHQLAAESLAGRIQLHHLREFGLRETLALQEGNISLPSLWDHMNETLQPQVLENTLREISLHRIVLQKTLREKLIWGGLPEVLTQEKVKEKESRISYLGNYLQTYLEKDIRDIGTLSDLTLYQKMMQLLAQQTGSLHNDKKIVEALGCSRDTYKKYKGYLEATLMYHEVFPFIQSSLKRLVKSPKGYLTNNGLISYLTGIYDENVLEQTGIVGHRFENWVRGELEIWLDRDPRRSEIYFWKTSGQVEVDLVVAQTPTIFPFEITWASRIDGKKVKHLQQFLHEEKSAPFGFLIYNGDFQYDAQKRIYFLPAWAIG